MQVKAGLCCTNTIKEGSKRTSLETLYLSHTHNTYSVYTLAVYSIDAGTTVATPTNLHVRSCHYCVAEVTGSETRPLETRKTEIDATHLTVIKSCCLQVSPLGDSKRKITYHRERES